MRKFNVTSADANRRLDKFLFKYLNNAPRSFIYRALRTKKIKLNGRRASGSETLAEGDAVYFYMSDEQLATCMAAHSVVKAGPMPPIIHEDENILVINKPMGMASHGGIGKRRGSAAAAQGVCEDHLLACVLFYLAQSGAYDTSAAGSFTPALCNRLDVNTSGVIVAGKTLASVQGLNKLFAEHRAEREYLAVVHGELTGKRVLTGYYEKDEQTNKAVVTNIEADTDIEGYNMVNEQSPHLTDKRVLVVTEYEAVRARNGRTLVTVRPVTGRSHQIRAHLTSIGHPLCGDKKYGGEPTRYAPAQLLHCAKVSVEGATYEAELPEGFKRCVRDWFAGCDI
jgi:23S rRNA pseudouridine955/2504/2580 synthase